MLVTSLILASTLDSRNGVMIISTLRYGYNTEAISFEF